MKTKLAVFLPIIFCFFIIVALPATACHIDNADLFAKRALEFCGGSVKDIQLL